ncbi:hypothetical protein V3C99_001852 [Haemonchus contortus]
MLWRTLCDDTATYDFPVLAQDYFEKLILIWKTQSQSVNRRLTGTVPISAEVEEYASVVRIATQKADYASVEPNEMMECEVRKLIPKDAPLSCTTYEVSFNEDVLTVVFVPVQLDLSSQKNVHIPFPYKLSCVQTSSSSFSLRLMLAVPNSIPDTECQWLLNNMFPALFKWLRFIDPKRVVRKTNALLDIESYSIRYRKLKENYGRQLVEKWTEKTDPKKFVYEDCGIAAYLLEFWRKRGRTPKKFADIGCGNGLLVYLLNKEGVGGVGIDIRRRKIWSELLRDTALIEAVVDPSKEDVALPEGVDYLIGNHTDELTPWMPVMAARIKCDFFVLPCCPFNFHGKYTARPGDSGSQYNAFLGFIREVCARLGFIVEEDRLSIPSTKRLCFVCTIPPQGLARDVDEVIRKLTSPATKVFLPRSKVEQVRNCLNVPKDIRLDLTKRFFFKLLEADERMKNGWRCGGAIELQKLAALLTVEEKQLMKQQCGGLQTFLRNQHQVFKVTGGMAQIRDWREEATRIFKKGKGSPSRSGVTPCWMAEYHPDGCPMKDACYFKH